MESEQRHLWRRCSAALWEGWRRSSATHLCDVEESEAVGGGFRRVALARRDEAAFVQAVQCVLHVSAAAFAVIRDVSGACAHVGAAAGQGRAGQVDEYAELGFFERGGEGGEVLEGGGSCRR